MIDVSWFISHIMKRVRCDKQSDNPQVASNCPRKGLDKFHDAYEEGDALSITPHRVCIEAGTRHKQDKG